MTKRKILFACVLACLALLPALPRLLPVSGDGPSRPGAPAPARFMRPLMGTFVELVVCPSPGVEPAVAAERVFAEIERLEGLWSARLPDSEVSVLNRTGRVEAAPETAALFRASTQISMLTGGAFDITVKPLLDAWTDAEKRNRLPDLAPVLGLVDYRLVTVEDNVVRLVKPGMKVDLGGVGKGAAADRAAGLMKELGVRAGIVNLGGDLFAFGPGPHRGRWRVGLQDPEGGPSPGTLLVTDAGVTTSGDYRRWYEIGGRRYSHILDPAEGVLAEPARSVTVTASSATLADGLATAVSVLGPAAAVRLLEDLPGVECLVIMPDGETLMTSGFSALLAGPLETPSPVTAGK